VTSTIGSAFLPYYELMHASAGRWILEQVKQWAGSSQGAIGVCAVPEGPLAPPREWAERFFNVQRWTVMPKGGQFASA